MNSDTEPAAKGQPVEDTSADVFEDRLATLRQLFPEAFGEGGIDFECLRASLGDEIDGRPERYTFSWAGKRDAMRILQTPTRATLTPAPEESVEWDTTQHLFIEGDNLEVLKLLYKPYFGRVKMIYIDPPYNTGNDFIYPDNYADPLDTYLKLTGQKDGNGNLLTSNPETSGRYHSAWISMMYPRLFLARQLLREDGVIFVSIDDHEVHNLRMLMNEVFGEENLVAQVTVQTNPRGQQSERFVATVHEYLLIFAKNISQCGLSGMDLTEEQLKEFKYQDEQGRCYRLLGLRQRGSASRREDRPQMFYPIYVNPHDARVSTNRSDTYSVEVLPKKSAGEDGRWMWSKAKVERSLPLIEARIVAGRHEWDIFVRDYLESEEGEGRTRKVKTIWDDKGLNYQNGTQELKELLGPNIYEYPKPPELLRRVLQIGCDTDAICLDFFAGSGTAAAALLQLNREDGGTRRFVIVQLPESTPEVSTARKAGFATIADIGKERIRRVIARMNAEFQGKLPLDERDTPEDLGFRVFRLAESNYRPWTGVEERDPDAYVEQMGLHLDPLVEGWTTERVIWEVALKEGFGLSSAVERVEGTSANVFRVVDSDKGQTLHICLDDAIPGDMARTLQLGRDDLFVCRDKALTDDLAANLALQCRLKTI